MLNLNEVLNACNESRKSLVKGTLGRHIISCTNNYEACQYQLNEMIRLHKEGKSLSGYGRDEKAIAESAISKIKYLERAITGTESHYNMLMEKFNLK